MKFFNHLNLELKNWIEINDNGCETHSTNIQIKFKAIMLKSSSCD